MEHRSPSGDRALLKSAGRPVSFVLPPTHWFEVCNQTASPVIDISYPSFRQIGIELTISEDPQTCTRPEATIPSGPPQEECLTAPKHMLTAATTTPTTTASTVSTTGSQIAGPCSTNPCLNGGTCVPERSTFICVCTSGFSGDECADASNNRATTVNDETDLIILRYLGA